MSLIKCTYLGDLNCDAVHLKSGNKIRTDAPLDHCGKGETFSPTDLLATSLGTCLLTIMAITANTNGWDPENIHLNIEKIMTNEKERKIKELVIDIFVPENLSDDKYNFLKKSHEECPVTRNLSKSLKITIIWHRNLK